MHRVALGRQELAELLLAKGAIVDDTDEAGSTPLHAAAVAGQEGAVRVVLAHGASVWTREIHYGETIYDWAAGVSPTDSAERRRTLSLRRGGTR